MTRRALVALRRSHTSFEVTFRARRALCHACTGGVLARRTLQAHCFAFHRVEPTSVARRAPRGWRSTAVLSDVARQANSPAFVRCIKSRRTCHAHAETFRLRKVAIGALSTLGRPNPSFVVPFRACGAHRFSVHGRVEPRRTRHAHAKTLRLRKLTRRALVALRRSHTSFEVTFRARRALCHACTGGVLARRTLQAHCFAFHRVEPTSVARRAPRGWRSTAVLSDVARQANSPAFVRCIKSRRTCHAHAETFRLRKVAIGALSTLGRPNPSFVVPFRACGAHRFSVHGRVEPRRTRHAHAKTLRLRKLTRRALVALR